MTTKHEIATDTTGELSASWTRGDSVAQQIHTGIGYCAVFPKYVLICSSIDTGQNDRDTMPRTVVAASGRFAQWKATEEAAVPEASLGACRLANACTRTSAADGGFKTTEARRETS